MLSDASSYSKHQNMQMHDTKSFLASTVKKMDWSHEDQDVVMDIGCGPGNSWRNILLPSFPNVKRVVAIDSLPDMIEFAKKNNAFDKIEYHVVDIQKRNSIEEWTGQITKVISIYCLHWLDEQEEALRNIYHVLKPGGEAALLFTLTCPMWDSYHLFFNSPKWSKYIENANPRIPVSQRNKNYDTSYYRMFLEEMGFEISICDEEDKTYTYTSDEECKDGTLAICGLTSYIPDELKMEFREDLFVATNLYNGRDSDGRPLFQYKTLSLLVKKA